MLLLLVILIVDTRFLERRKLVTQLRLPRLQALFTIHNMLVNGRSYFLCLGTRNELQFL